VGAGNPLPPRAGTLEQGLTDRGKRAGKLKNYGKGTLEPLHRLMKGLSQGPLRTHTSDRTELKSTRRSRESLSGKSSRGLASEGLRQRSPNASGAGTLTLGARRAGSTTLAIWTWTGSLRQLIAGNPMGLTSKELYPESRDSLGRATGEEKGLCVRITPGPCQ
jgi:hypothetical protein